jgi:hypothetical protein
MDAFVDKVQTQASRPMQVVSLRSHDSVELVRLRASQRLLQKQLEEQLLGLGRTTYERLGSTGGQLSSSDVSGQLERLRGLEAQLGEVEQRLEQAQRAAQLQARGNARLGFLTVCGCGAPLYPQDVQCAVCGRDVEALIRLASESKSQQVEVHCSCGSPLTPGIKFCPECGRTVVDLLKAKGLRTADAPRCAACGEGASPGDQFCSGCGKSLVANA